MPVFIYEDDAFEKLLAVEGKEYQKCKTRFGQQSFDCFYKHWKELTNNGERYKDDKTCISPPGPSSAIYGLGGFNRYLLRTSGEIIFLVPSDDTKNKVYAKKAKEIGFELSRPLKPEE